MVEDMAAEAGRRAYDHIEPCGELKVVKSRVDAMEDAEKDQWTAINALRNRLPLYATLGLSMLTFLLGGCVTLIVMLSNQLSSHMLTP
jgi:hypothetical protein